MCIWIGFFELNSCFKTFKNYITSKIVNKMYLISINFLLFFFDNQTKALGRLYIYWSD